MKRIACRELGAGKAAELRPLLDGTVYKPRRFLKDVPTERICDWWQGEIATALTSPGASALIAEVDGQPAGFSVLGDLPWESAILGKKMAAVKHIAARQGEEAARVLEALIRQELQHAQDGGYDFVLCKIPTDDAVTIHALERQGFLLMDTLLGFVLDLRKSPAAAQGDPAVPKGVELRIAGHPDRAGLVEVAEGAFAAHFGRFHSDPRIGPEWGRRIYKRWIESCLDGWADWIVVAEISGRIAGFTAWKKPSEGETLHGLGLGHYSIAAVHPDFMGRGVFRALSQRGVDLMRGLATRIVAPTHVNHYPIHQGLIQMGWRIEDAQHSFHKWLRD